MNPLSAGIIFFGLIGGIIYMMYKSDVIADKIVNWLHNKEIEK